MSDHEFAAAFCRNDVHDAFGLSYASYLVIPRALLQEMPAEWQHEFTRLTGELDRTFPDHLDEYAVFLRGDDARFKRDPLRNYRYPDDRAIAKARGTDVLA